MKALKSRGSGTTEQNAYEHLLMMRLFISVSFSVAL